MTDSLRDRIAAVLADADGMPWDEWSKPSQDGYLLRADAVIEALGLRVEHDAIDHTDNEPASHRYVTEWTMDE